MQKIYFMTSNKSKIATLVEYFQKNNIEVEVEGKNLGIIEPQADDVSEVSRIKAMEAFEILKAPVVVEDGGLEIEALKGFPGVYTKFIINTIGANGLIKLMTGETNRKCQWVSTTTFVNEHGELKQFKGTAGYGEIALERSKINSEFQWSELWNIFLDLRFKKVMSEMTKDELYQYNTSNNDGSSVSEFVKWYKDNWK